MKHEDLNQIIINFHFPVDIDWGEEPSRLEYTNMSREEWRKLYLGEFTCLR